MQARCVYSNGSSGVKYLRACEVLTKEVFTTNFGFTNEVPLKGLEKSFFSERSVLGSPSVTQRPVLGGFPHEFLGLEWVETGFFSEEFEDC